MQTIYKNLETMVPWTINNTTEVNPVPADSYVVTQWNGGMTTMVSGKAYAGALSHPPPLPLVPGATIFSLSYSMILTGGALALAQALEYDLMISGPDGSVANASCQCVVAQGFDWQIAKAGGGWIDTGIKTTLSPNLWITALTKFKVDWTKKTISCQSITVNGTAHSIPISLQNVPFLPLGWQPNIILPQRQLDLGANGGTYTVDDSSITVTQE